MSWPSSLFTPQRQFHPSAPTTTLAAITDLLTGEVVGWQEIDLPDAKIDATPGTSSSLLRPLGRPDSFVRGSALMRPFRPGGLDEPDALDLPSPPPLPDTPNAELLKAPPGWTDTVAMSAPSDLPLRSSRNPRDFLLSSTECAAVATAIVGAAPVPENVSHRPLPYSKVFHVEFEEEQEEEEEEEEEEEQVELSDDEIPAPPQQAVAKDQAKEAVVGIPPASTHVSGGVKREAEVWAIVDTIDVSGDRFHRLVPEMAYVWPFQLDVFQQRAVVRLERGESVFVSAHTSAGKTVVAEYAIALSARHKTRTIYTSPIKALSNQKFRDFQKTFQDVGIVTGDVQLNTSASCLIMTTEILRSMLYKGADLIRDVEYVIFDEVHYVNDVDRGVVWEEVIIMLPAHITIILLSATVPNPLEFADWVGRTKRKRIYVISTNRRPVPLEHFLFAGSGLHRIVDSKGGFMSGGYRSAMAALSGGSDSAGRGGRGGRAGGRGGRSERGQWGKIIAMLSKEQLLPVVVFTFSKRRCEDCAYGLSGVDLTSSREKSEAHVFIEKSVARLSPPDRVLPQILRIRDILKRGIGVHHGGLLPIVKEMVEILFSRGLVKILFATETFAMGVNMPARTVLFHSLRKHDGSQFRDLLPGEYTQMSGRAGRRGLDHVGTVVTICWDEVPEASVLSRVMLGAATKLSSQFRLTYNMILQLLRAEDMKVEDMLKRSFSEFTTQRHVPEQRRLMKESTSKLESMGQIECILGEPDIEDYHSALDRACLLNADVQNAILTRTKQASTWLCSGRIIIVSTQQHRNSIGVLLGMKGRAYRALLLVSSAQSSVAAGLLPPSSWIASSSSGDVEWVLVEELSVSQIVRLCRAKLTISGPGGSAALAIGSPSVLTKLAEQLAAVARQFPEGPPAVHPLKDARLGDLEVIEGQRTIDQIMGRLVESKCHACPKRNEHYVLIDERRRLGRRVEWLQHALSDESLHLMPEYEARVRVLQELGYADSTRTVQLKGRVACEVNACNSLVITEAVFENLLDSLEPAEIVAILSTLVFEETVRDAEPQLTPQLQDARQRMEALMLSIADVQLASGLDIPPKEFVKTLNWSLVEVVHEWALGTSFAEICELTPVQEGSIVRCMVRLEELCREVRNAARVIGDRALFGKMELCSEMIKRDIVFATSLYLS